MARSRDQEELLALLARLPEEQRDAALARFRQIIDEIGPGTTPLSPGAKAFVERSRRRASREERLAAVGRMSGCYAGTPIDDSREGLYPDADERP